MIEVADSSLELDRLFKGAIYARAGIPEYWIVNLLDLVIEVYTNPRAGRKPAYQTALSLGTDELVALRVGGVSFGEIPVSRILRTR